MPDAPLTLDRAKSDSTTRSSATHPTLRLHPTALLLLILLGACGSIAAPSSPAPTALAGLTRLVPGSWHVAFPNGQHHHRSWHHGPGRHSLWGCTRGAQGDGTQWEELRVVHAHANGDIGFLVVHSDVPRVGRGVGAGIMHVDGDVAVARTELWQNPTRPRTTELRWTFVDDDTGDEVLSEATGLAGMEPLASWRFQRVARQPEPLAPTVVPARWRALTAWFGGRWHGEREPLRGEARACTTTCTLLPYAEVVHVATSLAAEPDGDAMPWLDAFCYAHPCSDTLQVLVLTHSGAAYVGDVEVEADALQWNLRHTDDERAHPVRVRIERGVDGSLRQRMWADRGTDAPALELRHAAMAR